MAVAFDARTNNTRVGTTDPHTFSHTPVGTPRGVILLITSRFNSASDIDAVDYGGTALSLVGSVAVDTVGEIGTAECWFVGSGIPSGIQTVTIDFVTASPTDDYAFTLITVTAGGDTESIDDGILSESRANPSVALTYGGRTALSGAAFFSGRGTPGDISWDAGITAENAVNGGGQSLHTARQTTAGSSDFTMGATVVSDDVAFAAIAIAEVSAGNPWYYYAQQ